MSNLSHCTVHCTILHLCLLCQDKNWQRLPDLIKMMRCSQQGTNNAVYLSLSTSLQGGVEWTHLPCKAQCSLSLLTSLLGGVEWTHLLCRAQCSLSGWAAGRRSWVDTCGSWWGGQWSWEGCRSLLGRGQGHLWEQPMCRKDSRTQPGTPHTECSLEYFRLEIFGSG